MFFDYTPFVTDQIVFMQLSYPISVGKIIFST